MLANVLPAEIFGFLLITVRMAALIMVVPIFGERTIPQRARVGFAFAIALVVYPTISNSLPTMPASPVALMVLFIQELTIGLILGLSIRILLSSLHTAGSIIAFQTGLAAAQAFDPAQGTQSVIIAAFFNLIATVMILAADLHHLMLRGMIYSYQKFPVGEAVPITDFASLVTSFVAGSFLLGFQIASPFIVYGIIYNLGLGLVARMVQGFQVFFVGMPINIFMGFVLMMVLLSSIMNLFMSRFEELLLAMIG